MKTVVITPPDGLGGVYRDNRIWARQYAAHKPNERSVIQLKASSAEAVLKATETAALEVKADGQIIYAVGHGGAGDSGVAGQADFAPKKAFRVSQFLAYYNDRTGTWIGQSITEMEAELREAEALHGKKSAKAKKAWCGKYIEDACKVARGQVMDIKKLQPHYVALGKIFKENPVKRIVLLTCNVGNAYDFLDELATDLNVPVTAYTVRVMSRWEKKNGKTRVWMYLEGDTPGNGTNVDSAAVELLPHIRSNQIARGRIRARPPSTRSSSAPPMP